MAPLSIQYLLSVEYNIPPLSDAITAIISYNIINVVSTEQNKKPAQVLLWQFQSCHVWKQSVYGSADG